ncbi:PRC-barrel domain-containing protein [Vreelandella salicampi]|uniref:PRC-barrel domain-containing protein n=1 Tax=Vreelandella salicampi TaxID=1449798 RepID=A0A7Z0RVW1_9GAMM|nr:PRC-barrel domain-containing protein [Halomonas salicampi]NYS62019.1 PRC-barrel domain-containing protein [Halomonas salicampi]
MKKLKTFILSAAIAPAFALSTTAMAENDDAMKENGEQLMSSKPTGAFYADDVIGEAIKHRSSEEMIGEVQDLIIGEDGRIIGVVVKTSGFLGLGGQEAGINWEHIERTMEDDEAVLYTEIEEEALREAPEFERDEDESDS